MMFSVQRDLANGVCSGRDDMVSAVNQPSIPTGSGAKACGLLTLLGQPDSHETIGVIVNIACGAEDPVLIACCAAVIQFVHAGNVTRISLLLYMGFASLCILTRRSSSHNTAMPCTRDPEHSLKAGGCRAWVDPLRFSRPC